MKVLIVTGIFPPDIGGPATYVPQVAFGLVERGHSVTVLTLSEEEFQSDTIYPFQVIRIPRRAFSLYRRLKTLLSLVQLGRTADVLFINGLALESTVANLALRKPLAIKFVGDLAWERAYSRGWTTDTFEKFQQERHGWRIEILKTLRAWWTRRAHWVIVPSRYLARWVSRWGVPEEDITVVYNALKPPDDIQPIALSLPTRLNAVTVGRLMPWKRIDQILEAVVSIPDVGVVVIGDGPERDHLQRTASELGIQDRVHFAGQRTKRETWTLMASCDFFVLNSTYEGLPHVVLEAMGLGLPVATTPIGGIPEVVEDGENGLLFDPKEDDLSQILRTLQDEDLRRKLGERGRQTIRCQFHPQQMMEETECLLAQLANDKPATYRDDGENVQ